MFTFDPGGCEKFTLVCNVICLLKTFWVSFPGSRIWSVLTILVEGVYVHSQSLSRDYRTTEERHRNFIFLLKTNIALFQFSSTGVLSHAADDSDAMIQSVIITVPICRVLKQKQTRSI